MSSIEQHFENFLNTKLTYDPQDFYCQVTIKFFKRDDPSFQNAVLVSMETKTIVDMKIEDKEVFKKIVDVFGTPSENAEGKTSLVLDKKIDILEFVEKIISLEDDSILGFISVVDINSKQSSRVKGSQCFNYTIN
jgi:hypothetical protein